MVDPIAILIPGRLRKRLGLLQRLLAGEYVRPQASCKDIIKVEKPGFPAVRKANLVPAGFRHGFVPDDADAVWHQN